MPANVRGISGSWEAGGDYWTLEAVGVWMEVETSWVEEFKIQIQSSADATYNMASARWYTTTTQVMLSIPVLTLTSWFTLTRPAMWLTTTTQDRLPHFRSLGGD
jgi:hypothetical protein